VPTTPEERRQRRRLANFQDPSAAPSLKPPAPAPARLTPAAERRGALREMRRVWWVCGAGYWVQGFRCFPWLALNFHLTRGLGLSPAGLQLVQNAGSIPLVAKPLFGVLSDAVYIGRAHRLPYISLGGTQPIPSSSPSPPFIFVFIFFIVFVRLQQCWSWRKANYHVNDDARREIMCISFHSVFSIGAAIVCIFVRVNDLQIIRKLVIVNIRNNETFAGGNLVVFL
jgi:hypothetical protein